MSNMRLLHVVSLAIGSRESGAGAMCETADGEISGLLGQTCHESWMVGSMSLPGSVRDLEPPCRNNMRKFAVVILDLVTSERQCPTLCCPTVFRFFRNLGMRKVSCPTSANEIFVD